MLGPGWPQERSLSGEHELGDDNQLKHEGTRSCTERTCCSNWIQLASTSLVTGLGLDRCDD